MCLHLSPERKNFPKTPKEHKLIRCGKEYRSPLLLRDTTQHLLSETLSHSYPSPSPKTTDIYLPCPPWLIPVPKKI